MSDFDNTDRGALFKNEDKTPDKPNWADYQGNLNVGGDEYYISAWLKTAKSGKKFMSLSVKAKDSQRAPNPGTSADFDDDIPF